MLAHQPHLPCTQFLQEPPRDGVRVALAAADGPSVPPVAGWFCPATLVGVGRQPVNCRPLVHRPPALESRNKTKKEPHWRFIANTIGEEIGRWTSTTGHAATDTLACGKWQAALGTWFQRNTLAATLTELTGSSFIEAFLIGIRFQFQLMRFLKKKSCEIIDGRKQQVPKRSCCVGYSTENGRPMQRCQIGCISYSTLFKNSRKKGEIAG